MSVLLLLLSGTKQPIVQGFVFYIGDLWMRHFPHTLLCPAPSPIIGKARDTAYCNPLSVCPSVCPVSDPKSRTEGRSKLKMDKKEAHDTDDP